MTKNYLAISTEVQNALRNNKPVVALESTIISHGMPYPQNVETAMKVEQCVRDNGAIPATIGIIKGKMIAGLNNDEIEILGKNGLNTPKTSRRDMPILLATSQNGATTVASTMIIAQLAGIKIFATGGIGGVHRGAGETFDISADLQELARTNVAVICAGAKSILDIGLTLEYLETYGVPVIGFKTNDFPAFFTRKSGFKTDFQANTEMELANILKTKWEIPLTGGVIIANPVPEMYEADNNLIDTAIENALQAADKKNIKGKEITPFLLAEIERLTEGGSLKTNIQLVLNNAALAARLAKAFSELNNW